MPDAASDNATSLVNELARERNREAADRTLLAWIRTSLAMISLGSFHPLMMVPGRGLSCLPTPQPRSSRRR